MSGPYSVSTAEFPARAPQRLKVSFEFSPPKTEAAERTLWETVTRLAPLQPTFFSVTYGAGGSTRQRTHETVARLKKETGVDAAAHLTCVGATQGEIDDIARAYWDAGIRHIVALRGDPPAGMGGKYSPHPGGYANAAELVAGLKKIGDFQISVAGYPEKHPDSADAQADLENLKRKVDAGADRCITQFFFEADDFLRFRDSAAQPASTCRSCRASCRCRTSRASPGWPACAAPRCRRGWPTCSTASTTTSRPAA